MTMTMTITRTTMRVNASSCPQLVDSRVPVDGGPLLLTTKLPLLRRLSTSLVTFGYHPYA
ncbi:hypothetical protein HBI42_035180 [Parastagonospora nodorum]|nr:hypothetical protein HBI12_038930 [Parastagonospora nodorum]KAH6269743.1 hypothetical protein HBI42_035180 [Parastagonospora nodorum]